MLLRLQSLTTFGARVCLFFFVLVLLIVRSDHAVLEDAIEVGFDVVIGEHLLVVIVVVALAARRPRSVVIIIVLVVGTISDVVVIIVTRRVAVEIVVDLVVIGRDVVSALLVVGVVVLVVDVVWVVDVVLVSQFCRDH